jgi:Na+-transporting methylmalonyl-CoA/oxaloacetate decarboxylase gamma subunit
MEWIQELLRNLGPEKLLWLVLIVLWALARLVQFIGSVLRKALDQPKSAMPRETREIPRELLTSRTAERAQPQPAASPAIPPVPVAPPRSAAPQPERPSLETLAEKMIREIEWAMKETPDEPPQNAPASPPPAPVAPKSVPVPAPVSVPGPRPVAAPQPSAMRSRSTLPPRRSKPVPVLAGAVSTPPVETGHVVQIAADGRRLTASGIEIHSTAHIQGTRFDHLAVLRSPEDLQKAILLHEILSPPVAMRPRRFRPSRMA